MGGVQGTRPLSREWQLGAWGREGVGRMKDHWCGILESQDFRSHAGAARGSVSDP